MRVSAIALLIVTAGAAEASSLIMLPPMEGRLGASMVEIAGATQPISHRSMIALGTGEPAVSRETLSAIGPAPKGEVRPGQPPRVIRAGVTGESAVRAVASQPGSASGGSDHEPPSNPAAAAEPPMER